VTWKDLLRYTTFLRIEISPYRRNQQIRLIHRGIPVDIMLPRDFHDREVIERRMRKKMKGKTIWIPTAEDFIIQKLKVGRPGILKMP